MGLAVSSCIFVFTLKNKNLQTLKSWSKVRVLLPIKVRDNSAVCLSIIIVFACLKYSLHNDMLLLFSC